MPGSTAKPGKKRLRNPSERIRERRSRLICSAWSMVTKTAAAVALVRAKKEEAAAVRRPVTCRVCGATGHSMRSQDCPRYGEAPTKTRARAPGNKRAPCKYKRSAASQHREIEQQKKRRAAKRKQAEIERLEGSA